MLVKRGRKEILTFRQKIIYLKITVCEKHIIYTMGPLDVLSGGRFAISYFICSSPRSTPETKC